MDSESGGPDVPLPCPLILLLPSAPVAPALAPALAEGAIVFGSWAVVISESAVMTIQNAASNDWKAPACKKTQASTQYEWIHRS